MKFRPRSCSAPTGGSSETSRVHHAARRDGGGVAACGARAAGRAGATEPRRTLNADSRDQSLVDARDRSFQSAPCFCQFIRIWRLVLLFLPSATDWLSATQWNRTMAAVLTTRICGSRYSSDRNVDFPLVALAMKVALSSTRPSEWL